MSHVVPQTTTARRIHLGRRQLAGLAALLAVATALAIALIASNGGGGSQPLERSTPSIRQAGPNEAARGQAAATAAGVPLDRAGHCIQLRRTRAACVQVAPSGPDEGARGQSVASAAR